jgi:hypothetical protein
MFEVKTLFSQDSIILANKQKPINFLLKDIWDRNNIVTFYLEAFFFLY